MRNILLSLLISLSSILCAGPVPEFQSIEISDLRTAQQYGIAIEKVVYLPIILHPEKQCGYEFVISFAISEMESWVRPVNSLFFSIVETDTEFLVWSETIEVSFESFSRSMFITDRPSHNLVLLVRGGQTNQRELSVDLSSLVREAAESESAEHRKEDETGDLAIGASLCLEN